VCSTNLSIWVTDVFVEVDRLLPSLRPRHVNFFGIASRDQRWRLAEIDPLRQRPKRKGHPVLAMTTLLLRTKNPLLAENGQ
jgi:hypothetical protein